jgi:hypothetical protein
MFKNFFHCNYVTIGVTLVKILGKYGARGVNYTKKSFIKFGTGQNTDNLFRAKLAKVFKNKLFVFLFFSVGVETNFALL